LSFAAAFIYWVIVSIWLIVLATLIIFYIRNPRIFGAARLLLTVLAIDTTRNIIENIYFGVYFGGQYEIFPVALVGVLSQPSLLIMPKVINVIAGSVVLSLLLLRWLPSAIRERRQYEKNVEEARKLNDLMDELVANVSHELRTPLTSIAGSLGLLAAGASGQLPDTAARLVSIAHNNARRLVRLVNDILDLGKIESGNMSFAFAAVDLRAAAEQAIDENRAFAEAHEVSVRLDKVPSNCEVRADPDRLIQILTNLMSNAIKVSPIGSEIVITIQREPLVGRILVRDHGPGVPVEFRSRVFQRFAQAEVGGVQQKSGTGLGLCIVTNIVAQHGGTVGFEDAPDGGTIFYVEIPLWDAYPREGLATTRNDRLMPKAECPE